MELAHKPQLLGSLSHENYKFKFNLVEEFMVTLSNLVSPCLKIQNWKMAEDAAYERALS